MFSRSNSTRLSRGHGRVAIALCSILITGCSSNGSSGADPNTDRTTTTIGATSATASTSTAIAAEPSTTTVPPDAAATGADIDTLSVLYGLLDLGDLTDLTTFLTVYGPTPEIRDCMINVGFEYELGPTPAEQAAVDPKNTMSAADYAQRYGFGFAAERLGLLDLSVHDPNSDYRRTLSTGQRDAYDSTLSTCSGLGPDSARDNAAFGAAVEQFRSLVAADTRTVNAVTAWSACMAQAGFAYTSPQDMRIEIGTVLATTTPTRDQLEQMLTQEIATATANVPCEAAYRTVARQVVADRSGEFQPLVDAARSSGTIPDNVG